MFILSFMLEISYITNALLRTWKDMEKIWNDKDGQSYVQTQRNISLLKSWLVFWICFLGIEKICYLIDLHSFWFSVLKLAGIYLLVDDQKTVLACWIEANRTELQQKFKHLVILTITNATNILQQINHVLHPSGLSST